MPIRLAGLPALLLALALALAWGACGGGDGEGGPGGEERSGPAAGGEPAALEHIHGLGIDPNSGTLFVATHHGLYRAPAGRTRMEPVGRTRQDIMGFSVAGPDRFIGSGHPGPDQDLPANLGLIESRDGGETWRNVSLLGEADFHVLRAAGRRVYGLDSGTGRLLVSADGGRSWARRTPPGATFDLVVDPADPRRLVASTEQGLLVSGDSGVGWRPVNREVAGLLAWPRSGALFLVDGRGEVWRSADRGRSFDAAGTLGEPPVAFAAGGDDLYAALGDGRVLRSADGGAGWELRAAP